MSGVIKIGEIKTPYQMLPSYMLKTEKKCPKCGNPMIFNNQTKQLIKCCYEYALGKSEILKQIHSKENEIVKLEKEINILKGNFK